MHPTHISTSLSWALCWGLQRNSRCERKRQKVKSGLGRGGKRMRDSSRSLAVPGKGERSKKARRRRLSLCFILLN